MDIAEITVEEGTYGRRAVIHSLWTRETAGYLFSQNVVELELNMAKGWRAGTELSFLADLQFLRCLEIFDFHIADISPIHFLGNLKRLGVTTYCKTSIDFARFPYLESCGLEWRPRTVSLFDCVTLRKLFINRYKGKDTEAFRQLVNLESLGILNAPIADLRGFSSLQMLRKLRLGRLVRLVCLDGIGELSALEELEISTCRKVNSIEEIGSLSNLRKLCLLNMGEIASLRPLDKLKKLEWVIFDESTNILDGDLTPLLRQSNLTRVAFQNRKHYSHRREEFGRAFTG